MCIVLTASPLMAATPVRGLLAHGTDQVLWLAEVRLEPGQAQGWRTLLFVRRIGEGETWQSMGEMAGRAVGLANRGSDLIVLRDDGLWLVRWSGGGQTGLPLPLLPQGRGRIIAMASDTERLWAVALVAGGLGGLMTQPTGEAAGTTGFSSTRGSSSTQGASAGETGATLPSDSRPSMRAATEASSTRSEPLEPLESSALRPVLLSLNFVDWRWKAVNELPEGWNLGPESAVSLTIADRTPLLALLDEQKSLRTWRWINGGWESAGAIHPSQSAEQFKLLNRAAGTSPATLWSAGVIGAGELYSGPPWSQPTALASPGDLAGSPLRTLVVAAERLRVFYVKAGSEQIYEQQYTPAGAAQGSAVAVETQTTSLRQLQWWIELAAMVALVVAVAAAMRRRRAPPTEE